MLGCPAMYGCSTANKPTGAKAPFHTDIETAEIEIAKLVGVLCVVRDALDKIVVISITTEREALAKIDEGER